MLSWLSLYYNVNHIHSMLQVQEIFVLRLTLLIVIALLRKKQYLTMKEESNDPSPQMIPRLVYQTSTACTRSSKLIDFNFRFLHRRLATNSYLQKIGIREDNNCTFCHNEKEDLMHLFWQCEETTIFWQNLSLWLQSCQILTTGNNLSLETALGLKPDSSNFKLQINFCCLLAKQHIWICRLRELHPTQNNFLIYLKHMHLLENKTPSNTSTEKKI